jgi:hypothetical protein
MTTFTSPAANRSFAFVGTFIDAMEKAILMSKAVRHDTPSAEDIKRVRAIAETI